MVIGSLSARGFAMVAVSALLSAATAAAQSGDVSPVHDPTVIEADGRYHLFCTGRGIPHRVSEDLRTWRTVGPAIDRVPDWATRDVPGAKFPWAPDVSRVGGEYRIYYSVSTYGSNRSAIGLLTRSTLDPDSDEAWTDGGRVVRSTPDDSFNAIDPYFATDADGRGWLFFGSFWDGLNVLPLNPATGLAGGSPRLVAGRGGGPIEAPAVFRRGGWFYLFASFDFCCKGADSDYNVRVGRSRNLTGPYKDRNGVLMSQGGGTPVLFGRGDVRGPGHCDVFEAGGRTLMAHHFYDAARGGRPTVQVRPLVWVDGWPAAGEPVGGDGPDRTVAGAYRHSANDGTPGTITFLPDGTLKKRPRVRWSQTGSRLTMRWPDANAPGGYWTDTLEASPDGRWYGGFNQSGALIRGVAVEQ